LWKSKPVIAADVGAIPLQIRDGDTGYFYQTPSETAQRVIYLLENSQAAEMVGKRGRRYVEEHFLLPDRIADCLMAVDMTMNHAGEEKLCVDCIVSFHPWFKLTKRSKTL
jgi:trehalose synthase